MRHWRCDLPNNIRRVFAMSQNGPVGCVGTARAGARILRCRRSTWLGRFADKPPLNATKVKQQVRLPAEKQWLPLSGLLGPTEGLQQQRINGTPIRGCSIHQMARSICTPDSTDRLSQRITITQCTAVAPGGEYPLWQQFLQRITSGDETLQRYLQRVAGYALTGSTQEHALFFLYGTGANGKSVFLNTIAGILGGYHRIAPIETFTASNNDRHPTELAGLRAARLVTSIETEEGRRWAESKIKMLTGGDKIAARFMRQDFFEFTPQFKLVIAGNHKPGLRSVDEAIRRRFNLVPFTVTIPREERDDRLTERLRQEWVGILQWMIDGCLDWHERKLAPPEAVTTATAEYLESEDAIAAWIDDCAERDPNAFEKSTALFASYTEWANKAGEYVGSQKRFAQALETRGIVPFRHYQSGRGFHGLRLKNQSLWQAT